jgi:excisionase family DNA binding protein
MTDLPPRTAPITTAEFFTQKEAAAYMRCSYWTIREACYTGDLPCAKVGKRFVIHIADLRAWFERQKKQAAAL